MLRRCKPEKMILIQKIIRGHLERVKNKKNIRKFKIAALVKSKGYMMA